ncbi:unnamed protein product [Effrenium voratum]|nr:unnamed protein product [Effrenium voratum]
MGGLWRLRFLVPLFALAALPLTRRADIPRHLLHHAAFHQDELIDPGTGEKLKQMLRDLGADEVGFPTNVAADLKTGVRKVKHRHVGEARPAEADGSCSHPLLARDGNSSDCILPQRIDVGKHFVMTGGPEAIREPFEHMVSRVSSFGRYFFELPAPVRGLFEHERFRSLAQRVCPPEKQLLDPFQFNFILSVPGQTVALHLDAPYFVGASRFQVPQWLLAVMVFSGLFQDRFVDQVQVVGYLHETELDPAAGGFFLYYDENDASPKQMPSRYLSGVGVDGSKTLHAAGVFQPQVKAPLLDKDKDNALFYVGDERWELRSEGQVVERYNSSDLRMTVVYRARCFASEAERQRFLKPDEMLSLDAILDTLSGDLLARGVVSKKALESMDRLALALQLLRSYVKYPLPSWHTAWIPWNYCALPRQSGRFAGILQTLLRPVCQ